MTPADLLAIRKAGLERKLMGTTYQVKCLACNETHDFGKVDVRDLQDAIELVVYLCLLWGMVNESEVKHEPN